MRSSLGSVSSWLVHSFQGLFLPLILLPRVASGAFEKHVQVQVDGPQLMPRAGSDLINIPIHTLQARSPADNTTFGAGLTTVALSSDRQCVQLSATLHPEVLTITRDPITPSSRPEALTFALFWTLLLQTCGYFPPTARRMPAKRYPDTH